MPYAERTTQATVLETIANRLRSKISRFNASTCFVSDQPEPFVWPQGDVLCTVAPGDGRFPEEFWIGSAASSLVEETRILVTVWIRVVLDKPPEATQALIGQDKGVLSVWKREILRALLVEPNTDDRLGEWTVRGPGGNSLLRDSLRPLSAGRPMPSSDLEFLGMTIDFHALFDWDV